MGRIFKAIKHFMRLTYLYLITRIYYCIYHVPKVLGTGESLKSIFDKKLSISRYGDGEFMIMNGRSIKFQKFDKKLQERLEEILYKTDENGFKVCIPNIYKFKETRKIKYDEEIFWLEQIRKYPQIYLNKKLQNSTYLDSFISRFYIRYKNSKESGEYLTQLRNLWENKKIIIVEGEYSRLGVNNNLFANASSIKRIICPSKDAFDYYDEILNTILKKAKNELILLALGPTATILAYDIYKNGKHAIDIGHIDLEYEWYLRKATKKIAIQNKIVNEVENQEDIEEELDNDYQKSIIRRIGEKNEI